MRSLIGLSCCCCLMGTLDCGHLRHAHDAAQVVRPWKIIAACISVPFAMINSIMRMNECTLSLCLSGPLVHPSFHACQISPKMIAFTFFFLLRLLSPIDVVELNKWVFFTVLWFQLKGGGEYVCVCFLCDEKECDSSGGGGEYVCVCFLCDEKECGGMVVVVLLVPVVGIWIFCLMMMMLNVKCI